MIQHLWNDKEDSSMNDEVLEGKGEMAHIDYKVIVVDSQIRDEQH